MTGIDHSTVLKNLALSKGPSRRRDAEIAQLLGWHVERQVVTDQATGETKITPIWYAPGVDEPCHVPYFTSHLGTAQELAMIVAPGQKSGCSWEPGMASARIGSGPYFQSATPHLALCMAAVDALRQAPEQTAAQ